MSFNYQKKKLNTLKRLLFLLEIPVVLIALPIILMFCLLVRVDTLKRQQKKKKPRLIYGPVPIISIKYISQAMEQVGYTAKTFVYSIYRINTPKDYDYYLPNFSFFKWIPSEMLQLAFIRIFGPYYIFFWLLPRFDIFHFYFNGGFLAWTPLRFLEVQLLHLAGKKVIVMPYGSDVSELIYIHSLTFRHNILSQYPELAHSQHEISKQIRYFSKYADFIIGAGCFIDCMPRWDLLTTHYYPIDTDAWVPTDYRSDANGKNGNVTIFHSPNHRWLKGTDFFIKACQELEQEGYKIRLIIMEGSPNTEVHQVLAESDILAEQFGMPWYGLNAMEGMSLGKPVLSDLSDKHYTEPFIRYAGLDECPIVNTPVDKIKENLRLLIKNPKLRRELGEAGRRYVLKFHSYQAMGKMWDAIYQKVWFGKELQFNAWHPERSSIY